MDVRGSSQLGAARRSRRAHRLRDHRGGHDLVLGARIQRRDRRSLPEQTATIPQTGAQIKLDHFNYRYEPIQTKAGLVYQPIDYVSQVQYVGKDGVARLATIRVNHPLDIDGTLYYQAAYGFGAQFVLTKDGRATPNSPPYLLKEGDSFSVGGDRALEYDQFVGTVDR